MRVSDRVRDVVELELYSRILTVATQVDCLGLDQSVFAELDAVSIGAAVGDFERTL